MNTPKLRTAFGAALLLGTGMATSGCSGGLGDFSLENLGGPVGTPAPTPAPAVATVAPVALPTLGTAPAAPVNPAEKERIAESDQDETLTLRFVQSVRATSVGTSPMSSVAEPNTTAGGATLTLEIPADPDADITARFSLGNPTMGVSDVKLTLDASGNVFAGTLADGRMITVALGTLDQGTGSGGREFEWTAYGGWAVRTAAGAQGSPFVTGYETPDSAIPTSGNATFNGFVQGQVLVADGADLRAAALSGDATIVANFAAGTLTGAAPSIMAIPLGVLPAVTPGTPQPWNALTFNGTFTTGLNGFTGTTAVSSAPGNSYSLSSGATGLLAGRFYGPGAEELGAIWNLYDGNKVASGFLVGAR